MLMISMNLERACVRTLNFRRARERVCGGMGEVKMAASDGAVRVL